MPDYDDAGQNIIAALVAYTERDLGDRLHAELAVQNHLLPIVGHMQAYGVDRDLPNYHARRRLVDNYAVDALRRYDITPTGPKGEAVLKAAFSPDAVKQLFTTANNPQIFGSDYCRLNNGGQGQPGHGK